MSQTLTDTKSKSKQNDLSEFEFYNLEEPGLMQKFSYGSTRNYKRYTFLHGGKYKIPREIADHLESRQTPIWKYRPDGEGAMRKELVGWKPRFQMREIRSAMRDK